MNHVEQQDHYHGNQEIYGDAGHRDTDVPQDRPPVIARIYGYGFCPADDKRPIGKKVSDGGYGDGPQRVDMGNGVERDTTLTLGRAVSEQQSDVTVRHLMEHDTFH